MNPRCQVGTNNIADSSEDFVQNLKIHSRSIRLVLATIFRFRTAGTFLKILAILKTSCNFRYNNYRFLCSLYHFQMFPRTPILFYKFSPSLKYSGSIYGIILDLFMELFSKRNISEFHGFKQNVIRVPCKLKIPMQCTVSFTPNGKVHPQKCFKSRLRRCE